MKYRTKLYLSLVGVALASIILGLVIFSTETEKLVLDMLRSHTLSIAATSVSQLDDELFAQINKYTKVTDPAYIEARRALIKILNANRRGDVYVSDIYTLFKDPDNENVLLFGLETDEDPDLPGDTYTDSDKDLILKNMGTYFTDPKFVTDQYGVWLSAFAPIRKNDGKLVGTLGVDINVAAIHLRLVQLIKFGIWGLSASLVLSIILAYFLSKRVTTSLHHLCHVVKEVGEGKLHTRSTIISDDEFGELSMYINAMCQGLEERERLKLSFARYVSGHVLNQILESETPMKLEGERKKITLLFSDIRQFTQLAERLKPEEVVQLLNEYFEQMIEAIFSHFGTLDKFIGDGIMAEFGAPLADEKQEEHAILAAIAMQKALHKLSDQWEKEKKPRLKMGIGIHTGEAILGNIGSEKRVEYTAVGDSVNVASRLEQATKILNVPILISEVTYLAVKDRFPFKDLGSMALPGRKEQIRVYTIVMEKL